ncbi:D-alanine-D-alanine ligase [Rhodovulum sp. ES.010]|uniref:hypothetical protein n=1 Tax=Rhodovulum sp. ES.010 TaxID=1882821 RepID=UPI00092A12CF|nr:hypothetical protein [Rhodovulum sp. ES.010]SIO25861.1 D-alanine-D-alanine ligase [Rhodovulum sp. ES.010]
MKEKLNVAVLFGGASQEHDVSVVSAHQLMDAADVESLNVIPIYVGFENKFFFGSQLRDLRNYRPRPPALEEVTFRWANEGPELCRLDGSRIALVDCVLPVFHGPFGEDGRIQAFFELLGFPVTGFDAASSAMAMRKDVTKSIVKDAGVAVVDGSVVSRRQLRSGDFDPLDIIERLGLPLIVKPVHLGSSIGVGLVKDREQLTSTVEKVLREDTMVLIEPQVQNLIEFNVAIIWRNGSAKLSAIERPKTSAELLDFKEKYLSSGGGRKGDFLPSEGMLSLTRDINPEISEDLHNQIRDFACKSFVALGCRGAPRIDFLYNTNTGELWFNEINPIPGSYGFFLWEAADEPLLFPELVSHLVDEALQLSVKYFDDSVPEGTRLLPR